MSSEDGEGGLHIVWHVPKVEKGERLEVSFEIKGNGEVDAEALNRFHGVHFGDEVESDAPAVEKEDTPVENSDNEPHAEEVPAAEESDNDAEAEADENGNEAEQVEESSETTMNFREDVLLRVMEAFNITDRDAFVSHAYNFDSDDNGYLKKQELEAAAKAWNSDHASEGDSEANADEGDEAEDDSPPTTTGDVEEKACGICGTMNAHDATECSACKFAF